MHIVLIGDSIFDNASYVASGDSVSDILKRASPNSRVTLLAVDGDVTTDVVNQLTKFPKSATHVFVSCGGNDALRSIDILDKKVSTVGEAMEVLFKAREFFRSNYSNMVESVLSYTSNVTFCTIYNKIPGLSERALAALSIYNEVILEELAIRKLPLIDLRVVCNDQFDYSEVSPIEPSKIGGQKIVKAILAAV